MKLRIAKKVAFGTASLAHNWGQIERAVTVVARAMRRRNSRLVNVRIFRKYPWGCEDLARCSPQK